MSAAPDNQERPPTPEERYQADLERDGFVHDPAQETAVANIQAIYDQLTARPPKRGLPGVLGRFRRRAVQPVRGLYMWGGVGRGKTYLMDCFFECLPPIGKRRVHFHRFMEQVHDELAEHGSKDDPLKLIGSELASRARVLCFDEFHVSDIADAMLLAGLFETLFAEGVTLVATSNVPPRELYKGGLQRAKFLPAIDLIEAHCKVLNVDGGVDFRLRILERAEIYHHPLDSAARTSLKSSFADLCPGEATRDRVIHVNHRELPTIAEGDGIGWFEFTDLCEAPRATPDYIELARRFNTILISNVPQLGEGTNDPARRFINLVDELYDRNVNLIVSAAAPPEDLYTGERLAFEFQRTVSRLIEMQSHDYLAREHRP